MPLIFGAIALATVILHAIYAMAVWYDADSLAEKHNRSPQLLGPVMWSLTALVFGLVGLAVYWLVNRSRLSPNEPINTPQPGTTQQPGTN